MGIVKGEFEGQHGIVVGHDNNFERFRDSPTLKIIIADKTIVRIKQNKSKLLDLHGYLPFALLSDILELGSYT